MKKVCSVLLAVMLLVMSAVPVFAAQAEFVPSVVGRNVPNIVPDGEGSYGKAYDGEDALIYSLEEGDVRIIPLPEADTATGDLKEELPQTYYEFLEAGSLVEILPELSDITRVHFPGATPEDLAVTAIFGIQFSDAVTDREPSYVTLTLEFKDYEEGTAPIILFKAVGSDEWIAIDSEDVIVNPDGTLTVSFPGEDGVVTFLEQVTPAGPGAAADGDGGHCCKCPKWCFFCRFLCTGSGVCFCWLVLVVIGIIVAVTLYWIFRKKDEKDGKPGDITGMAQ